MKRTLGFWGSAAGTAAVFAALVPLLFPFRALGLDPAADKPRVWLLTVFCAGVMALLFGASGVIGGRYLGIRDTYFARGMARALEQHRQAGLALQSRGWMNAGTWTIALGASLVAIYFVLFTALG